MNKYIIVDMDLEKQILEFVSENEDAAIIYVLSLFNPPPDNYNLYQLEIDTDKNWNFHENARYIELPSEITEDGDYIF
jgi:hypothetical protein